MPLNLKTSKVWSYFDLKEADEAQCKHCPKILLCKGGSTVGLKRHLEKIHSIILSKEEEPSNKTRVQLTIDSMTTKVSLGERLARFAAIDGFSIIAITKSNQICELLHGKVYTKPKSKTDVINLINKYHMKIVEENKIKILEVKEKKYKFSIDLDEYSKHSIRFMNINLHFNKGFINVGLERIRHV